MKPTKAQQPTVRKNITLQTEDQQRKARAYTALIDAREQRGCTETQFRVAAHAVPDVAPNWEAIEQMRRETAVERGRNEA